MHPGHPSVHFSVSIDLFFACLWVLGLLRVSSDFDNPPIGGEHRRTLKFRLFLNSAGSEKLVLIMRERTVAKYLVCRVHLCRTPTGLAHPSGARVRLFITWVAGVVGFGDRVPQDSFLRQILQKARENM